MQVPREDGRREFGRNGGSRESSHEQLENRDMDGRDRSSERSDGDRQGREHSWGRDSRDGCDREYRGNEFCEVQDDRGPNRSSASAGVGTSASDGDAGCVNRLRDWCHKGKGREGTPDPRAHDSRVHSVLPSVTEGRVGFCNLVAAVPPGEGEAGGSYVLTPEHLGTIAVALSKAGFKPT